MGEINLPKKEEEIYLILQNCKIKPGDIFLLHTNITRWAISLMRNGINRPLNLILNSIIDYLGEKGTLILPTFNFDFCKNGYFDYIKTPSDMGSLSQESLNNKNFKRTKHPIYSFSVCGFHQESFCNLLNKGGTSKNSPFSLIHQYEGKIGLIDLYDQDAMTFYHYVEDYMSVPYRYHKNFSGYYRNENGQQTFTSYSLFVRNLNKGIETFLHNSEELLWENQLYIGDKPYLGAGMRSIDSKLFCKYVENIINNSAENFLYKINI